MGKKVHDTALTVDELKQRALKAKTLLAEIRALFPEAHGLAKDDRRLSQGKMGVDEAEALRGVVDAMDLQPAIFDSLADEDEGHDPNKLETALLSVIALFDGAASTLLDGSGSHSRLRLRTAGMGSGNQPEIT